MTTRETKRLDMATERVQALRRRRQGLPDSEQGLAVLVLGLPQARASGCQKARWQEFQSAKTGGGGSGDVLRELRALADHVRGRECAPALEELRAVAAGALEAIAAGGGAFRGAARRVGKELALLAARPDCWPRELALGGRKLSGFERVCTGLELLRANWAAIQRQRQEEVERRRREERQAAADRALDAALAERVHELDRKRGAALAGGEAASDPAAGGEDAAAAPPTDTKEVIRDDGDSRLA